LREGTFAATRKVGLGAASGAWHQAAKDPRELDAFRAAQRLAGELWSIRPHLRGNIWVAVVSRKRDGEAYYVAYEAASVGAVLVNYSCGYVGY
jgi:hypothetical protein